MNQNWNRVQTTRVYLHPPKAERLVTLWREGKIMLGEVELPITKDYQTLTSAGLWFFHDDYRQADFHQSSYLLRKDGIPIHQLTLFLGKLEARLECLTDFCKCPACYIRLTLKNPSPEKVRQSMGYLLRKGAEAQLIYSSPDVYASYAPDIQTWLPMASHWTCTAADSAAIWQDEAYFAFCSDNSFSFDSGTGSAQAEICLAPNEEKEIYFVLGKGTPVTSCNAALFEAQKAATLLAWEKELSRINRLPSAILEDPQQLRMIQNLTVQLLQCFSTGCNTQDLYSRQGGLQRRVWTYESMPVLEALTRIGDFDDYIEPVIDLYFRSFQLPSGEMVPLGIHWAMATATVLYSFATYARARGKEYYDKYRDPAMKSFAWIRETRQKRVYDGPGEREPGGAMDNNRFHIDGLFPPMSCSDDPLVFQSWLTTDCSNIMGLKALADTAAFFHDELANQVKAEYDSYRHLLQSIWDSVKEKAGDTDELEVPFTPGPNNAEVAKRYHFQPGMGYLTKALLLPPEDYKKIIRYYTRRGFMKDGLYNKMPDKDPSIPGILLSNMDEQGRSLIWYVCGHEYGWFTCFLHHGDISRCRQVVDDSIRFAMSDEYYMIERYHCRDPWYAPWSPNASANGRMINMMLDLANLPK